MKASRVHTLTIAASSNRPHPAAEPAQRKQITCPSAGNYMVGQPKRLHSRTGKTDICETLVSNVLHITVGCNV